MNLPSGAFTQELLAGPVASYLAEAEQARVRRIARVAADAFRRLSRVCRGVAVFGQGRADMAHGHQVRLVACGSVVGGGPSPLYLRVGLGHLLGFFRRHLEAHWPTPGHTDLKDPSLGLLRILAKAQRGSVSSRAARRAR